MLQYVDGYRIPRGITLLTRHGDGERKGVNIKVLVSILLLFECDILVQVLRKEKRFPDCKHISEINIAKIRCWYTVSIFTL